LEYLEKDGHDFCVLFQEIWDNIFRELADDLASSFSDDLDGVLQACDYEVSEHINVVFDWV